MEFGGLFSQIGNHSQRVVPLFLEDILFSECPRATIVIKLQSQQEAIEFLANVLCNKEQ